MNAITTPVAAQVNATEVRIANLEALTGQVVEGTVTNVAEYGVFLSFGAGNKESGLLHANGMTGNARARLKTFVVGAKLSVTLVSVKRKPNFHNRLLIELSELATPVNKLKEIVGTDTKVTGTIIGRFDDHLLVSLPEGVQARLPIANLGGTSLDALKKGVTVKASVASIDGANVTLTRENVDSVHARARRDAHRAEQRLLDQQYRSSKKSSGGGKKK